MRHAVWLLRCQLKSVSILFEGYSDLTRNTGHMKPTPDPDLRALLRRADPAAEPVANSLAPELFAADVRARINRLDTNTATFSPGWRWQSEINALAACLALLAALAAGGVAAYVRHPAKVTERHAMAYARSIDPVLMHAAHQAR